jgi:hypothetical protein
VEFPVPVTRDFGFAEGAAKPKSGETGRSLTGPAFNYRFWLAVSLGGLLAFRIAVLYLAQTELFFDEAQYWAWSREPAFGYYSKPPLIAFVIGASTALCGGSEFCIRLPSPMIHTATAVLVYLAAARLYDERTGFWCGLGFATLPGVSFAAGVISTDTPLLFFWAAAFYCFIALLEKRSLLAAIGLGLAIGFGLLAKYAMAYFLLCAAVYALFSPAARLLLKDIRLYAALALVAIIIAPNIAWNIHNQFATFSHTADNAKLSGKLFNPGAMLEFLGAQFGVFGPILFLVLIFIAWRATRVKLQEADRMLLCFSLPVLLLITGQAFLSRAHANWAAAAYVAGVIIVIAWLLRLRAIKLLRASFALHFAMIPVLAAGLVFAPTLPWPGKSNPNERMLGWRLMAETADKYARGHGYKSITTDKRSVTAEMLYYSRAQLPITAWLSPGKRPRDHFELSRPLTKDTPSPVLLVTPSTNIACIAAHYERVEKLHEAEIPTAPGAFRRMIYFGLHNPRQEAFDNAAVTRPACGGAAQDASP